MPKNPYVQVALTYFRRPLASGYFRLGAIFAGCFFIAFAVLDRFAGFKDSWAVQLMFLFSLFVFVAIHMKEHFLDSRAHLTPSFRRIHATVAAIVAIVAAGALPTLLSWFMGWHSIGFVAVAVLLFGMILWVIAKDATWTCFALLFGWSAFCATESGPAYFRGLLAGQFESEAVAILIVGIAVTLLAGVRLVRLREEMQTYDSKLRWDWDWNQKTGQGWSNDGRILPGLRDWIRRQEMLRVTRLARRAPVSWWSRICRWQVGMIAGWALWLWILGVLAYVQTVYWWISTKTPQPAAAMLGITSIILTFPPTLAVAMGMLQWRTFKLSRELLLPVARRDYIRQLGAAASVSVFQIWIGTSVALTLWWLLVGPRPISIALFGGALAYSAAFQVVFFGVMAWVSRYRSKILGIAVLLTIFFVSQILTQLSQFRRIVASPEQLLHDVLWIAGVITVFGVLITIDAYRRWLRAEFD